MDKSFIKIKIIPLGNASASTLAKFAKELDDAFHYNNTVINVRYVQSQDAHIDIGINPKMIHEIHSLFDDPDALFCMDFYDDVIDCITVEARLYHDEFVCDVESINTEKALFDIINKMRTRNKHVMFCASELDEYLNMFCKINKHPLMTGVFRILMHAFFKHVEYKQNEDSLSQVINEATVDLYNKQMKKATEEYKMNENTLNNPKVLKNIQTLGDTINELKALSDKYDVPIITATQQKNDNKKMKLLVKVTLPLGMKELSEFVDKFNLVFDAILQNQGSKPCLLPVLQMADDDIATLSIVGDNKDLSDKYKDDMYMLLYTFIQNLIISSLNSYKNTKSVITISANDVDEKDIDKFIETLSKYNTTSEYSFNNFTTDKKGDIRIRLKENTSIVAKSFLISALTSLLYLLIYHKSDRLDEAKEHDTDKSSNDDDYIIKMDGEKANFDGGAIRHTKTGKGRFDLIPADVVSTILDNAYVLFYSEGDTTVSLGDLLAETYKELETPSVEGYSAIVINIVNWVYTDKSLETKDDVGDISKSVSYPQFIIAFSDMLKDLAKHYENGAKIYGIDNWKKGIPVAGGDRGGSFTDSMLRHLSQYISATKEMYYTEEPVTFEILYDDIERRFYRKGLDGKLQPEENHIVASIWNAFGAIWTLLNDEK